MSKIEFNMENLKKCICYTCPVQVESTCAKEKLVEMKEMETPEPDMVPGVYCATGKAICNDLDLEQFCHCNECEIWIENKLDEGEPLGYFCRDGKAR